jgi:hypothetical protein
MKTIYNYHPETRELLSTAEADPSPLEEDVFLIPAFATDIEPPTTGLRQIPIFNEPTQQWSLVADWRGVALYSKTSGQRVSAALADTPESLSATELPKPSEVHEWDAGANGWTVSAAKVQAAFAVAKDARIKAFRTEREVVLNRLIGIGFAAMQAADTATINGCLTARTALLDLPKHPNILAATTEAQLKQAFKVIYKGITDNVPAAVASALVAAES